MSEHSSPASGPTSCPRLPATPALFQSSATSIIQLLRLLICRLDSPLCNIATISLRSKNGLCCSGAADGLRDESSSLPLLSEPGRRIPTCPLVILILANDFWLPMVCSARLLIHLVLLEQANLPSVAMPACQNFSAQCGPLSSAGSPALRRWWHSCKKRLPSPQVLDLPGNSKAPSQFLLGSTYTWAATWMPFTISK
ncbi:hypothetical protein BKA80DRAFT_8027 [Phyllosticta citrichinensis]